MVVSTANLTTSAGAVPEGDASKANVLNDESKATVTVVGGLVDSLAFSRCVGAWVGLRAPSSLPLPQLRARIRPRAQTPMPTHPTQRIYCGRRPALCVSFLFAAMGNISPPSAVRESTCTSLKTWFRYVPLRIAVRVVSGSWLHCVHGRRLWTGVVLCLHPRGDTRAHETVCRRPCGQECAVRRDLDRGWRCTLVRSSLRVSP